MAIKEDLEKVGRLENRRMDGWNESFLMQRNDGAFGARVPSFDDSTPLPFDTMQG